MGIKGADVQQLLEEIVKELPERTNAAFIKAGLPPTFQCRMMPPEAPTRIATFDKKVSRPLSPMLEQRFAFASDMFIGRDLWPGLSQLPAVLARDYVLRSHQARREHWDASAPQLFNDKSLSLFSAEASTARRDAVTYLVWKPDLPEPELWSYSGQDCVTFPNLAEYLQWFLGT